MQTIQIEVEDNKLDTLLTVISNLKEGLIQNFTINNEQTLEKDTIAYMETKEFKRDEAYFQKCLDDIQSGETTTLSHDEVWKQIDTHTQAS